MPLKYAQTLPNFLASLPIRPISSLTNHIGFISQYDCFIPIGCFIMLSTWSIDGPIISVRVYISNFLAFLPIRLITSLTIHLGSISQYDYVTPIVCFIMLSTCSIDGPVISIRMCISNCFIYICGKHCDADIKCPPIYIHNFKYMFI